MAEVGKAYERATENKEEADAMAKKVNLEAFLAIKWWAQRACKLLNKQTNVEFNEQSNKELNEHS